MINKVENNHKTDRPDVAEHLRYNPWLSDIYERLNSFMMSNDNVALPWGLDDTALYYLAQNMRKEYAVSSIPDDYFTFLKLIGGFDYTFTDSEGNFYAHACLFAEDMIYKCRTYYHGAVRGGVINPPGDELYIRLGSTRQYDGDKLYYATLCYKHQEGTYHAKITDKDNNEIELKHFDNCAHMLTYFIDSIELIARRAASGTVRQPAAGPDSPSQDGKYTVLLPAGMLESEYKGALFGNRNDETRVFNVFDKDSRDLPGADYIGEIIYGYVRRNPKDGEPLSDYDRYVESLQRDKSMLIGIWIDGKLKFRHGVGSHPCEIETYN